MPTLFPPDFTDRLPVKPGARVLVGGTAGPRAWITVTTVFSYGGHGHIVTCGHERGDHLFDGETRTPIAALAVNLLNGGEPVDMAVFRVTEERVRFIRPSYFTSRADYPYIGEGRVYTEKGPRAVQLSAVDAAPSHIQGLIESPQPLISCLRCAGEGDSGAPLHQVDAAGAVQLVGLHSGGDYISSYFTPVRDALSRVIALL